MFNRPEIDPNYEVPFNRILILGDYRSGAAFIDGQFEGDLKTPNASAYQGIYLPHDIPRTDLETLKKSKSLPESVLRLAKAKTKDQSESRLNQLNALSLAKSQMEKGESVTLVGLDPEIMEALGKDKEWSEFLKPSDGSPSLLRMGGHLETIGQKDPQQRNDLSYLLRQDGAISNQYLRRVSSMGANSYPNHNRFQTETGARKFFEETAVHSMQAIAQTRLSLHLGENMDQYGSLAKEFLSDPNTLRQVMTGKVQGEALKKMFNDYVQNLQSDPSLSDESISNFDQQIKENQKKFQQELSQMPKGEERDMRLKELSGIVNSQKDQLMTRQLLAKDLSKYTDDHQPKKEFDQQKFDQQQKIARKMGSQRKKQMPQKPLPELPESKEVSKKPPTKKPEFDI